ncbi:hypothetical protein LTR56_004779 [Elasticomyces elasticus]|nr:hypothetical protein LTR56_004779 [Elasticomyces elasticus]KAK3665635.1 hypothetical protein LTR22_003575 [Elasticomyces elasticus]KAK4930327.1 hypothetical protein LTR49_003068 [Elasticomyces elasticus]KAK5768946.1 hypothetical protein LTS12_001006 [Elasticomyces elasticus]
MALRLIPRLSHARFNVHFVNLKPCSRLQTTTNTLHLNVGQGPITQPTFDSVSQLDIAHHNRQDLACTTELTKLSCAATARKASETDEDLVCAITNLVDVEELLEFRLVCRWAERESFCDFATRGLKYVDIEAVSGKTMPSRLKAVENSLQFASAIKSIRARFPDRVIRNWESDLVKGSNNALFGNRTLARRAKEPTLSYVVSRLPKFESFTIEGLTGPILDLHMLPDLVNSVPQTAWWRLQTLKIECGLLSSTQWLSLIRLVSPALSDLSLDDAVCTKGRWLPVLTAIQETLPALTTLNLVDLTHRQMKPLATNEAIYVDLDFTDKQKTIDESTELVMGSETLSLRKGVAIMQGRQAVRLGLERIVRYQESVEEALSMRF